MADIIALEQDWNKCLENLLDGKMITMEKVAQVEAQRAVVKQETNEMKSGLKKIWKETKVDTLDDDLAELRKELKEADAAIEYNACATMTNLGLALIKDSPGNADYARQKTQVDEIQKTKKVVLEAAKKYKKAARAHDLVEDHWSNSLIAEAIWGTRAYFKTKKALGSGAKADGDLEKLQGSIEDIPQMNDSILLDMYKKNKAALKDSLTGAGGFSKLEKKIYEDREQLILLAAYLDRACADIVLKGVIADKSKTDPAVAQLVTAMNKYLPKKASDAAKPKAPKPQ